MDELQNHIWLCTVCRHPQATLTSQSVFAGEGVGYSPCHQEHSQINCSTKGASKPTVKLLLGRIKDEEGKKVYQGAPLTNFSPAVQETSKQHALDDLTRLDEKMKERLKWSDIKLLWSLLVFLEIQTWMKQSRAPVNVADTDSDNEDDVDQDCSLAEVKESVEHIATHFRLPLEAKGVLLDSLQDEVEEAVEYA